MRDGEPARNRTPMRIKIFVWNAFWLDFPLIGLLEWWNQGREPREREEEEVNKKLAIGTKVEITWSHSPNSDKELGEIVSLPTPRTWQEVKFADGVIMELPRYMMTLVREVN